IQTCTTRTASSPAGRFPLPLVRPLATADELFDVRRFEHAPQLFSATVHVDVAQFSRPVECEELSRCDPQPLSDIARCHELQVHRRNASHCPVPFIMLLAVSPAAR